MVLNTFGMLLKNVGLQRCPHGSSLQHISAEKLHRSVRGLALIYTPDSALRPDLRAFSFLFQGSKYFLFYTHIRI
jgi:hypothetical protein